MIFNIQNVYYNIRYVEIYNTGVDFNAQEIKLEGLDTMANAPDILVPHGSYLVFYADASSGAGPLFLCNAIYIACKNDDGSENDASNGCSLCSFNNNMDKKNWNIAV
eukprot:245068_1